jgi:hypothetical protein
MKHFDQADLQTYRLIVLRRDGSEILLVSNRFGWTLPWVQVSPRKRIILQLVSAFNRETGFQAYCLFLPSFPAADPYARPEKYAVLECVRHNGEAPKGACWLPCTASASQLTSSVDDNEAIKQSLRELDSYANQSKPGSFGKPGWLSDLFMWVEEQLGPWGLHANGNFQQFNGSPTFSLIRLETSGPAVWFKATGEPNRHELPITTALTRLFPENLPRVLGVHPSWNGWLSEEVTGTTLDQCTELPVWERVANDLAELQIASAGKDAGLLGYGCKDLRIPNLVDLIDPFFARMSEFMGEQRKQTPSPLTNWELSFVADRLKQSCSLLHELHFPQTLGHMDFNPGNILMSATRSAFLDWAEACVTNPLVTFEYLLEHLRRSHVDAAGAIEKITAAYLRPWRSFVSPEDLARGKIVSPLVAVFVYSVSGGAWRSREALQDPKRSGYLRSLTRRMFREATQAGEGGRQCVA